MQKELIFHLGCQAGFYSEFNNMILALLYCKLNNIKFILYSKDANFATDKGWCDYFKPFCKESINGIHKRINLRMNQPFRYDKYLYYTYKRLFPNTYLTFEKWNEFRHLDNVISKTEIIDEAEAEISRIYVFNEKTSEKIKDLSNTINLHDKQYIGFHIRGGDKVEEHELKKVSTYIEKAESLTQCRVGFVSTDDYSLYLKICELYPDWTFCTLTDSNNRGFQYSNFLQINSQEKYCEMIKLFASIEILRKAQYAICTYSSNVGMFLGMVMKDRAIGIDYDKWMIW